MIVFLVMDTVLVVGEVIGETQIVMMYVGIVVVTIVVKGSCRSVSDKGGTKRSRRLRVREDDDDFHMVHWDDEWGEILPLKMDTDSCSHRSWGYSPDGFGIYLLPWRLAELRITCKLFDLYKNIFLYNKFIEQNIHVYAIILNEDITLHNLCLK